MVYAKKFALAIRAQGKILREINDIVALPFGTEYEIILKNLNSVRAQVNVWIDGKSVTSLGALIVPANQSVTLERSITGSMTQGNRFKFIEMTDQIADFRGVRVDDGLIRIEYQFEKVQPKIEIEHHHHYHHDLYHKRLYRGDTVWCSSDLVGTSGNARGASNSSGEFTAKGVFSGSISAAGPTLSSVASVTAQASVNLAGITVEGFHSAQAFTTVSGFTVEDEKHTLVLKLVGKFNDEPVEQPITVKTKIECTTCGYSNQPGAKFCNNCGTSLQLFS